MQPGPDDPVAVGLGEPCVAQQGPRGEQHFMAYLYGPGGEGEEPLGGESLEDRLYVPRL